MPNGNDRIPIIVAIIVAIIAAIGGIIAAYIGIIPVIDHELATIQGIVTDNDGKSVIGALVEIDGSSVTTGIDGGYVIHSVPINTKTITVRAFGAEVFRRALSIPKGAEIIRYDITLPPVTPRPTPTPTTQITPSTTPSPMSSPTSTPTSTSTPTPTSTPRATTTATPTPGPSPTPGATTMPSPTPGATTMPSPTPSPTPTVFSFLGPKEGDYVKHEVPAKVQVGDLSGIQYLWFVTVPSRGTYHPQGSRVSYTKPGEYDIIGFVGNSKEGADEGYVFRILIVGTDEYGSKSFEDYIRTAASMNYPGLSHLPETAKTLGSITVIRRDKITLTYNDFDDLNDVCTLEDNYCGWANVPGKAVIYGSMTTDINVPEGASELEVTISISCNGYGEGLSGQPGSAANIRVDSEERAERIDSTMSSHHGNYYRYEWCDTFSNTFNVRGGEEITLKIEMSGGARLDFEKAILTFS